MTADVSKPPPTSAASAAARDQHGTLANQIRVTIALLVAGVIFYTVGWIVMQPIDPRGPITLLAVPRPITTLLILAGLSIIAAGLATLIAGRSHPNMGAMAVGFALAALNLHGAESDKIGGYVPLDAAPGWPTMSLIFEVWLWLALVGLGYAAGRWCHAWMNPVPPPAPAEAGSGKPVPSLVKKTETALMATLPAVILTALAAYLVLPFLCGSPANAVLKYQMYFAAGGSFLVGAALAQLLFKPDQSAWPLLAIGLVGTAVYMVASPIIRDPAAAYAMLRYMPGVMARPLPIELVSCGAIGGFFGLSAPTWFSSFEQHGEPPGG